MEKKELTRGEHRSKVRIEIETEGRYFNNEEQKGSVVMVIEDGRVLLSEMDMEFDDEERGRTHVDKALAALPSHLEWLRLAITGTGKDRT